MIAQSPSNSLRAQRLAALTYDDITIYEPSRLTDEEICSMDRIMKSEKYMTAIPLSQWRAMEKVWTVYKNKEFVGLVAAVPAGTNCFEVGPVYLDESCRGKGITSNVISLIEQNLSDNILFTMSHNPAFQKIMARRPDDYWNEVVTKLPIRALPVSAVLSTVKSRVHWSGIREYFRKKAEGISAPGKDRWWVHVPSTTKLPNN